MLYESDLQKLCELAQISFTREEYRQLLEQLPAYQQLLAAVEAFPPGEEAPHGRESGALRLDRPEPPALAQEILQAAPETAGRYFKTPGKEAQGSGDSE